jgi:two-component system cell cycle sensor histidine kinase/response regulator CckA
MGTFEELREALLNLEEARKKEAQQRRMAEALLAGLRVLVMTENPYELFSHLFEVMREPLDFRAAFVLQENEDGILKSMTSSDPAFTGTSWRPGPMLRRAMDGQPVAVFDTGLVDEWKAQPENLRENARSALHFSIHTTRRRALFVCTHPQRGHFSRDHVTLTRRFSFLVSQALQQLESKQRLSELQKRLEAEEKLTQLNQRLMESEKKLARARKMEALGLLAGGVAHDLNNILSGIVSYPELLLAEEELRPEQRNAIKTIRDSGLRAAAIVDDLLTVARGVASPKEILNINGIVREYLASPEHLRLLRIHDKVRIETDLKAGLLNIKCSRIHISKALMNLVSNAVEASDKHPSGRVIIRTKNTYIDRPLKGYSDVEIGEYVLLAVSDTGGGISEQDVERVFEPFYARKAMGRSGTGLGLTIVWNTVNDHNGYVDLETGSEGTTFRLYFPVTREAPAGEETRPFPSDYMGKGQSVLVVDDLEDQRKIACAMLKKLGYEPWAVSSGEDAIEYLKEHRVDILLLDMVMDPGINGGETYKRIVAIRPGQKAVIASGYSRTDDVRAAQRLGAGRFIKKPYTLQKLGEAIREELEK